MSDIRANTISDAAGTGPIDLYKQSAAKAWVNFNGTGTIAIRDSFNTSSLTDNGTGAYTVTFTNNMSNGNYSFELSNGRNVGINADVISVMDSDTAPTTSSLKMLVLTGTSTVDVSYVTQGYLGDLA